jgi:hypothetical protein
MRLGIQNTDWAYVGARLARAGDDEQAEFFKSFVKEAKTWGTQHQVDFQLAAVNHKLTADEREVLGMLSYEEGKEGQP